MTRRHSQVKLKLDCSVEGRERAHGHLPGLCFSRCSLCPVVFGSCLVCLLDFSPARPRVAGRLVFFNSLQWNSVSFASKTNKLKTDCSTCTSCAFAYQCDSVLSAHVKLGTEASDWTTSTCPVVNMPVHAGDRYFVLAADLPPKALSFHYCSYTVNYFVFYVDIHNVHRHF